MKIGFILTNEYPNILPTGGIGVFVKNITKGLKNNGFDVEVILISHQLKGEFVMDDGVRINFIKSKYTTNRFANIFDKYTTIKKLSKLIKKRKIDIVEISTSDNFMLYKIKKFRIIARTHGSLSYAILNYYKNKGRLEKKMQLLHENNLLHVSEKIITISNQYYTHYKKLGSKVVLIENFIGKEFSELATAPSEIKGDYVFFHGTLKDIKGVIELAKSFKKSAYFKDHFLVYAGKSNQKIIDEIKAICNDKFIHLGELSAKKIIPLLKNCTLAVYPSKRDAFNLAVVEAMSQACLVLVSSAIDDVILKDGVTGLRFPLDAINSFEEHLNRAFNLEETKRNKICNEARKTALSNYSFENGIQKNSNFYKSLLNTKK